MLKHNLKIAWRSFLKDKQFSLLNLIGLTASLACVITIYLWVNSELNVDKFHTNNDRLFQVLKNTTDAEGNINTTHYTQGLLSRSLTQQIPEIKYAVCVKKQDDEGVISFENKRFKTISQFVDQQFFDVFSYKLIEGSKHSTFSGLNGILISDELAIRLFNRKTNIIGKTLTWDSRNAYNGTYIINGVFEAPPSTSSDKFDALFNYELYIQKETGQTGDVFNWQTNSVYTYVVLNESSNIENVNAKIKNFSRQKLSYKNNKEALKWEGSLFLQRYSDKYLYSNYENGVPTGGNIEYVKLFSVIAIFILIIASINFINLSTVRASKRLKEVGVKKVIGASRGTLIKQYLCESFVMVTVSMVCAFPLVLLLLPLFNRIAGKTIEFSFDVHLVIATLCITIITCIAAGAYPALYLSNFKPISILKGYQPKSWRELSIRKGLVVFQFALSTIFIISVFVIYKQMQMIQTKNLGYDKEHVIRFSNEVNISSNLDYFLTRIKSIPGVINASSMDGNMTGSYSQGGGKVQWEGKKHGVNVRFEGLDMDYDMLETLKFKIIAGRPFSRQFASDTSTSVIFNKTAIDAMGLKDPIGKTVNVWGEQRQIIGIVEDFHFESFHQKITPFFFRCKPNNSNIFVRINAHNQSETLSQLSAYFKQLNGGLSFQYNFLDDDYRALYSSEEKVATLSKYFATLGILISCLGLFGLVSFTARVRQKEMVIRKVVGASVSSLAIMLSKDFFKLVLLGALIAFPLAVWMLEHWLNNFVYRIKINPGIFILTSTIIIVITAITVSFQSLKAALQAPVKSLKAD